MISYQLTSSMIGVAVAATIIYLVRRGHMHGPYAVWWLSAACVFFLLGLFPRVVDQVGVLLGVSYPPMLAVLLGFVMIVVKVLLLDLERSRQEVAIRRLVQRVALLQDKLHELETEQGQKS